MFADFVSGGGHKPKKTDKVKKFKSLLMEALSNHHDQQSLLKSLSRTYTRTLWCASKDLEVKSKADWFLCLHSEFAKSAGKKNFEAWIKEDKFHQLYVTVNPNHRSQSSRVFPAQTEEGLGEDSYGGSPDVSYSPRAAGMEHVGTWITAI